MKIFFDATFGEAWVGALTAFFRLHRQPGPLFIHIYDKFPRDVADDEWIPNVLGQDNLIISCDRGRKQPRLPELCKQHNKTHIIFSPSMHHAHKFSKARAIVVLWPKIAKTVDEPPGSRFQLQALDAERESFRLVKKT